MTTKQHKVRNKVYIIIAALVASVLAFMLYVILLQQDRAKVLQQEIQNTEDSYYVKGYIDGAYQALKSDSLVLGFIKTYDVSPAQQGILVDILDMSRGIHQQVEIFFPDLADDIALLTKEDTP